MGMVFFCMQGYDLGTIQSVASLSKGSLLDQSLQIGSMMLLSNVLKISGFYVRLSRMVGKIKLWVG